MFYHAKNGTLKVAGTDMDYVSFGSGGKYLIMLPGVGDGLKTVKGMALIFSVLFRQYSKHYRVLVFSRRNQLPQGYSTRDMARDLKDAMEQLQIGEADILGISQGGMIAQYLAADYPNLVHKLVLAVTSSGANETLRAVVQNWLLMAETGNYKGILIDTFEKSYSDQYLKKYRRYYPVLCRFSKPRSFGRFMIQAQSCMEHDADPVLDQIRCPVFIIGGCRDQIVGGSSSSYLAEKIVNSHLFLYEGLGHGAYEEAGDFHDKVLQFLLFVQ